MSTIFELRQQAADVDRAMSTLIKQVRKANVYLQTGADTDIDGIQAQYSPLMVEINGLAAGTATIDELKDWRSKAITQFTALKSALADAQTALAAITELPV